MADVRFVPKSTTKSGSKMAGALALVGALAGAGAVQTVPINRRGGAFAAILDGHVDPRALILTAKLADGAVTAVCPADFAAPVSKNQARFRISTVPATSIASCTFS